MEHSQQSPTFWPTLRQELQHIAQPRRIVPNLLAGLITGLMVLISSISYAALVFSGPLTPFLSFGITCSLICALLASMVVAVGSSFRIAIAGPDSNAASITALLMSTVVSDMAAAGLTSQLLPTALMLLIIVTTSTGLGLFLVGVLRLGNLVRYLPYPVVGGFLSGTGWLLISGAFKVFTDESLNLARLDFFVQPHILPLWAPGVLFGLLVFLVNQRYKHYLMLPVVVLVGTGGFYAALWLNNLSLTDAMHRGLLFEPFSQTSFWLPWSSTALSSINWPYLVQNIGSIVSLSLVVIIVLLLNSTGIELATNTEANLNRELQISGLANLAIGPLAGLIGIVSTSRTLMNVRAGGTSRLSGLTVSAFCLFMLLVGTPYLAYFPKPILGGLLIYLGCSLFYQWLYRSRFVLSRANYALIWVILLTMVTVNFLDAIALGVLIATVLFTINYSRQHVVRYELTGSERASNCVRTLQQQRYLQAHGHAILILGLEGYIFFGTSTRLLEHIRARLQQPAAKRPRYIVLDFLLVSGIDESAAVSYTKLQRLARQLDVHLVYTTVPPDVQQRLYMHNVISSQSNAATEADQLFPDLDRGLEWCENQLLQPTTLLRQRYVPMALHLDELFPDIADLQTFMGYLTKDQFAAGDVVFRQGDPSEVIYFVEYGRITLTRQIDENETRRLQSVGAGMLFGELGLYRHAPRTATATADVHTQVYQLGRAALERMEREHPVLALSFHRMIVLHNAQRLLQENIALDKLLTGS